MPVQTGSYTLTGLCHNGKHIRRTQWKFILPQLEQAHKRLINWCPSVGFPLKSSEANKSSKSGKSSTGYPQKRTTRRSMLSMCFNPDMALRLRLVPIEGM